jgi:hypothetical protein
MGNRPFKRGGSVKKAVGGPPDHKRGGRTK